MTVIAVSETLRALAHPLFFFLAKHFLAKYFAFLGLFINFISACFMRAM